MTVVVAGQWRKVGKTQAMCDIIAATPDARWVAVKITPHAHEPGAGPDTDTARYLAAGAAEAHLSAGDVPAGENVIIESNAVLDWLQPDLAFLVTDPANPEWKESGLNVITRTINVVQRLTPDQIDLVRARLSAPRP